MRVTTSSSRVRRPIQSSVEKSGQQKSLVVELKLRVEQKASVAALGASPLRTPIVPASL
jgi:hypothetical protein